jgi:hypothetical protein
MGRTRAAVTDRFHFDRRWSAAARKAVVTRNACSAGGGTESMRWAKIQKTFCVASSASAGRRPPLRKIRHTSLA